MGELSELGDWVKWGVRGESGEGVNEVMNGELGEWNKFGELGE